ncbi:hypothetical protein Pmar_PMAR007014, partial [Perkinsus marinus ATCC 50983]
VVLLITSFVNEGLFKRLFGQARPPQSACEGPGMPSGHCITSGVLCKTFMQLYQLQFFHTKILMRFSE